MAHKVLIADDQPNLLASLDFMMRREGYAVSVARDGAEAVEAIRRDPPALVLLDVAAPGLTGFEVCEAVRADPACAGVRILMLSAKARQADIERGLGAGADGYVVKPFSMRELAGRVRELLA